VLKDNYDRSSRTAPGGEIPTKEEPTLPNGIIIIDKPAGWTSMDVCAKLRGVFREKRVGHAGTLDPMATGILPVFVGRATRAVEFTEGYDKEYIAGLKLGVVTNTQDTTGEVLERRLVTAPRQEVEAALAPFRGEIQQVPPMYSAIKIGGKKLYELARKGQEVERKPRTITIQALELLDQTGEDEYRLRVACSKGTYVRTLCHDIGAALGCGGTMSSLRRTRVGPFTQGITLEEVQAAADAGRGENLMQGVDGCFAQFPAVTATRTEWERFIRNGASYRTGTQPGIYRVYGPEGEFLMLGKAEGGRMTTVKSFF
jgi:tRNA pseudouridine55 synthase